LCYKHINHEMYIRTKESKRDYRIRNNKRFKSTLIAMVDALKTKPCMDCGRIFKPWQMDFDHRDSSTKRFSISKMVSRTFGIDSILEEIAKCDLVCACCHRDRTHERDKARILSRSLDIKVEHKEKTIQHGTFYGYKKCGPPKCELCKAANNARNKRQRDRYREAASLPPRTPPIETVILCLCGKSFSIKKSEEKKRKKRSRMGQLYCSSHCANHFSSMPVVSEQSKESDNSL